LYISASDKPDFSEEDLKKLKLYIDQGGTILSATECFGPGFRDGMREVYKKILPDYKLKPVPLDHPLYRAQYKMTLNPPAFFMIHNGVRPLVLHTDKDLPRAWQLFSTAFAKTDFEIASNLLMYATDRGELRNRGVTHWPDPPTRQASSTVKLARVVYKGNWNPEPQAFNRFSMLLTQRTGVGIEVDNVAAEELADNGARIACLTGTGKVEFSDSQLQAIKQYVDKGGLLMIDAAGGSPEFAASAEAAVKKMYDQPIRKLSSECALFKVSGNEIDKVSYRRKAKMERGLTNTPELRGLEIGGRLAIVFSPEDITGGLLGIPMHDCAGYSPDSSYEIMRNTVLLAGDVKTTVAASPAPAAKKK
jgi:hypothetical protein